MSDADTAALTHRAWTQPRLLRRHLATYDVLLSERGPAAARVATSNACLYEESRARERWQRACSEVSTALLSGDQPEQVLALVTRRARALTGARLAVIALLQPGGELLVEAQDGAGGATLRGRRLKVDGELGGVLLHGSVLGLVSDELAEPGRAGLDADPGDRNGSAVALGEPGSACGVLAVLGLAPSPAAAQLGQLEDFARQAAVGLELAQRRRDAAYLAVHNDRDRIARDLHDLVIQRLFATGMSLQSVIRLVDERPEEAVARVHRAVDELDTTIRELRSTIYGLQAPVDEPPSLRSLLLEADAATAQLGFAPSLRLSGLLDTAVPPETAEHLIAAVREALSNAARHAQASRVDVVVSVRDGSLVLQVDDDGVGIAIGGRRSGLVNLSSRADELGGELVVTSAPQAGTSYIWQVPLPGG